MTQPQQPGTGITPPVRPSLVLVQKSLEIDSPAFAELCSELLGIGVAVRFRAKGDSMAPLVRHGDTLSVEPLPRGAARAGDVVLFRSQIGYTLAHRVIGQCRQEGSLRFTIQGDNLQRADGVIPPERIYGKVVSVERGGVAFSLSEPPMMLLGWLAVVQSRWGLRRRRWWRAVGRIARQLLPFARYLA
ncbi:MAG TPA: S24/S26 family peptidase [Anaerolineae bacterium]|nr:S24/S26 family peptidase [Anaerolineae bacterium]